MRKKRLIFNTISSLAFQLCTIICGFILPRLIISEYGSEVNGLVNSITQFLAIVGFLELGVGAVVQSALYKPISENNTKDISKIIASANKFFNKLGHILLLYVIVLSFVYPHIVNQKFGWIYSATLILAMSISSFAQYFLGIVDRLLLNSDQRGYIQYTIQTIALVFNTIVCVILIKLGSSIQFVKLVTSITFLLVPICIRIYVNNNYEVDRRIKYSVEPIKQKWNGIAQHIAAVVLDSTDVIVLTVLSTLQNVSIYSVYLLVVNGVKRMFLSLFNGFQALIGELWARQELDNLRNMFANVEWIIHTSVTFVFTCVGLLIVQFVQVYTLGINDTNYIQPLFAVLLTIANAGHCLRLPYNIMILAAGHYKQTQSNYIIATILNIVISIVTVFFCGLIGVAIGTLVAMMYQTVWMAVYNSKNLLNWPFRTFVKQIIIDIITVLACYGATRFLVFSNISYVGWVILAIQTVVIVVVIMMLINLIFYKERLLGIVKRKLKI